MTTTKKRGRPASTATGPLFDLQLRLGLTQDQLAERLTVSKSVVVRHQAAGTMPGKRNKAVRAVLESLGVDPICWGK